MLPEAEAEEVDDGTVSDDREAKAEDDSEEGAEEVLEIGTEEKEEEAIDRVAPDADAEELPLGKRELDSAEPDEVVEEE